MAISPCPPPLSAVSDTTAMASIDPSLFGMFLDLNKPLFDEPYQMFSPGNFGAGAGAGTQVVPVTGPTPLSVFVSSPCSSSSAAASTTATSLSSSALSSASSTASPSPFLRQGTSGILADLSSSDSSPDRRVFLEDDDQQLESLEDPELLSPVEDLQLSPFGSQPGLELQQPSMEAQLTPPDLPAPPTAEQKRTRSLAKEKPAAVTKAEQEGSSAAPATVPAPAPLRRRSTKPPKTVDEKRERNRLAAERYRKRGRDTISSLTEHCNELMVENEKLASRNKELESEVMYLRQMLERSCLTGEMEPYITM